MDKGQEIPPGMLVGMRLKAVIHEISGPEDSQYGKQRAFQMELAGNAEPFNRYKFKTWCAHYDRPTPKSKLGELCLMAERITKQRFQSVDGALAAIKSMGVMFVEVKALKPNKDDASIIYPNFKILTTMHPMEQPGATQVPVPQQAPAQAYVQPPQPQLQSGLGDPAQEAKITEIMAARPGVTREAILTLQGIKIGSGVDGLAALDLVKKDLGIVDPVQPAPVAPIDAPAVPVEDLPEEVQNHLPPGPLEFSQEAMNWLKAMGPVKDLPISAEVWNAIPSDMRKELMDGGIFTQNDKDEPIFTEAAKAYM